MLKCLHVLRIAPHLLIQPVTLPEHVAGSCRKNSSSSRKPKPGQVINLKAANAFTCDHVHVNVQCNIHEQMSMSMNKFPVPCCCSCWSPSSWSTLEATQHYPYLLTRCVPVRYRKWLTPCHQHNVATYYFLCALSDWEAVKEIIACFLNDTPLVHVQFEPPINASSAHTAS